MALNQTVIQQGEGVATYPSVFLHNFKTDEDTGQQSFGKVKQLLFGDWIGLKPNPDGIPDCPVNYQLHLPSSENLSTVITLTEQGTFW